MLTTVIRLTVAMIFMVGLISLAPRAMRFWPRRFVPALRREWRKRGWRLIARATGTLLLAISTGVLAMLAAPGWLRHGWLYYLPGPTVDGNANFVAADLINEGLRQAGAGRGLQVAFLLGFGVFIVFLLPLLAWLEEQFFRSGCLRHGAVLRASFLFGLYHMIAGIPLPIALGLAMAGLSFGYRYREAYADALGKWRNFSPHIEAFISASGRSERSFIRELADDEAVDASTVLHTIYNLLPVSLFFVGGLVLLLQ